MKNGTFRYSILYVDDEHQNLYLFRSFFEEHYDVLTAESGAEALDIMARREIQLLLADQRMPGMNGIQLLETVAREYPETVRVLVTGYSDIDVVIDAINRGSVYRYLSKPWDIDEINATIRNALEVYELRRRNKSLIASLHKKIEELNFLNDLQLDLKGLTETDGIIEKALARLEKGLEAEFGCHCELRAGAVQARLCTAGADRRSELEAMITELDLANMSSPVTACPRAPGGRGFCVLPLRFQGTSFGHLVFLFPEHKPFDREELPFAEAASHMVSSVLYSQHIHRQEMKKEQFLVLGQMASMIVHDLKGPLSTILGFVSMLQAELAAARREEFTGIINQEVRRLIDLVEELLAFSKGQSHLEISPFDLAGLIREVVELFEISLAKESIQTESRLNGLQSFCGDRKKLKKVFINLMQNAREFLQAVDGPRHILIRTSVEDGALLIRFINNGPSIPDELLPRLFDPFFSHDKDQGTGLGLTICKKIIEEHGGAIEVFSEPGRNEFRIVLPLESPPCQEPPDHNPGP